MLCPMNATATCATTMIRKASQNGRLNQLSRRGPASVCRANEPLTLLTMNQPTLAVKAFRLAGRILPRNPKAPRLWTIWGTPNLGPQLERMACVSEPSAVPRMIARAPSTNPMPKKAMGSTPTNTVANSRLGDIQVQKRSNGWPRRSPPGMYSIPPGSTAAAEEPKEAIEANGALLTPSLVEPHIHLDAVLTVGQPRHKLTGSLFEGIAIWGERVKDLTVADVKARAEEVLRWQVANGVLFVRSHVDVCDPQLTALRALIEVRAEVKDVVTLQLVAFPQQGILSFPDGEALMRQAVTLGADVVGAIPHFELTRDYGER